MLFDTSSPGRRRVVRVVYGGLAALFFIGFVFFGIGTTGIGGSLLDAVGISNNSGTSTADQYEQQISEAEDKLELDPSDEKALAQLASYRYLSGSDQLGAADPETGVPTLTDESRQEFEAAIEAWNRYIDLEPARADLGTAQQILGAFLLLNDAEGAAEVQAVVADRQPTAGNFTTLAYYLYYGFDLDGGDAAAARAKELAKPADLKAIEKQLAELRKTAVKGKKQLATAQATLEELPEGVKPDTAIDNPFGNLSGGSASPTTP